MEQDLDSRFERLEKALGNMIDALAKNNPSDKVAEELLAAEADLSESLKLLETHQNNNARIQQLRQETSLLDTQIKDIASSLWNMRKELKAVPTTSNPPNGAKHQFTTAELLAYARRISRNTLPLPGVTNGVDMTATQPSTQPADPEDSFRLQTQPTQTQTPNASFNFSFNSTVGTPAPLSAATPTTTTANDTQPTTQLPPSQQQQQHPPKPPAEDKLPQHLQPAVNPLHDATFHPWPTEAQIRSGALASIQRLADSGIDPKGYDPAEEERKLKEQEQARKEAEERARQEREAAERRMREERERMARERELARQREGGGGGLERRESVAVGRAKPKQFTFLGADDDDDDEDED
ncbi:vitamin-D-receptor interacting mediator subunit 4-domain-containing protein [Parachaetomium inaequale]|uniref:Mediator of RNA polymerase II transcription subunit 4 n=1 Tax=Parachaetomium inaequale TaxID=2588326 RepID=A0AAN6P4X9_9PEZI|nr:vitamin-D-receptor interacting mediator subunit 4-domain-containing protein [Parachaetomium inaequale]